MVACIAGALSCVLRLAVEMETQSVDLPCTAVKWGHSEGVKPAAQRSLVAGGRTHLCKVGLSGPWGAVQQDPTPWLPLACVQHIVC